MPSAWRQEGDWCHWEPPEFPAPLAPSPTLSPCPAAAPELECWRLETLKLSSHTGPKSHHQPCGGSRGGPRTDSQHPTSLSFPYGDVCVLLHHFPLLFQHWIWKQHTGLSVDGSATSQRDAPSTDGSPIPVLPDVPHPIHNTGIASTLEPFPRGKRWSLPWKGRLCLDLLEVVHWSCCSFCLAQGHFPRTSQRLSDLPTDTFLWEQPEKERLQHHPPSSLCS